MSFDCGSRGCDRSIAGRWNVGRAIVSRSINEEITVKKGVTGMACFSVPLAAAAAASAVKSVLPESAERNPFVARLPWLGKMMFGGSFLLAIEHIYHGEITFMPPFLTAVKEGPEAVSGMLHEMATRGVAMTVLLIAVWVGMVAVSAICDRRALQCASS